MNAETNSTPRRRKSHKPELYRPGHWGDLDHAASQVLSRQGLYLYQKYKDEHLWGPRAAKHFSKSQAMGLLNLFIVERFIVEIDERAAAINQLAQDLLTPDGLDRFDACKISLSFGDTRLTECLDRMELFVKDLAAIEATDEMAGLERTALGLRGRTWPVMYSGPQIRDVCPFATEGARP